MKKLLLATALLLLIVGSSLITYTVVYNSIDKDPVFKGSLDEQVDNIRAQYDLPGLEQVKELDVIAQSRCDDFVSRKYFAHTDPDGLHTWQKYKFTYSIAGENLAYGYSNAYNVADGWVNSKTHKANLLDPNFKQVGYGICWDNNHYKVVQVLKG